MSKYTTQVRFICESYAGLSESVGYDEVDNVIHSVHNRIMGDYPIFDEEYREVLNTKILRHYYTREICEETVGLWKLRLNNRMKEIMPYYNQLYKSELLKFNPLYDVDITTMHNRNEDSKGSSERDSSSNSVGNNVQKQSDKYSDTPQGAITGLENGTYLTNARIIDNNDTSNQYSVVGETGSNSITSTEDYLEHVQGKRNGSSYAYLLKEYRETFLNIDKMIIEDLYDLFFGLWE